MERIDKLSDLLFTSIVKNALNEQPTPSGRDLEGLFSDEELGNDAGEQLGVDPKSAILSSILTVSRQNSSPYHAPVIKEVEDVLNEYGYETNRSNIFDEKFETALKTFQNAHKHRGTTINGKIDSVTLMIVTQKMNLHRYDPFKHDLRDPSPPPAQQSTTTQESSTSSQNQPESTSQVAAPSGSPPESTPDSNAVSINDDDSESSGEDVQVVEALNPEGEGVQGSTEQTGDYVLPKFSFSTVPCKGAAALAIKEAKENWDNGNIPESDPRAEEHILKYYKYTSLNNSWENNIDRWQWDQDPNASTERTDERNAGKKRMNPVKERKMINGQNVAVDWWHWSAVYITWVMSKFDGEGARWFKSEGHSAYIRSYQKVRRDIERDPEAHKGKMLYVWFTREEMVKYDIKTELGDVVGTNKHCDIYIGNNQIIGGNTCAKSDFTGGRRINCRGTSGPQPLRWKAGAGIIKRIKITGPGKNNQSLVA